MRDRLGFIEPMMPTLVSKPPSGNGDWLTEVKFDGWRCQIVIDSGGVRVFTRRGFDWTDKFKIIAIAAADELKLNSAIIDGELVYPHKSGLSDFQALQTVVRSHSDQLIFMAFDLLHHDGEDLRLLPVEERRERLDRLIRPGGRIQYSDGLQGTTMELFAAAERMGLEGIVCKRRGSPYVSGSTLNWLKVKTFFESEFELLGVQRETGKPTMALMVQLGTRQYVGSAFVTFGRPASDEFRALVEANPGPPPRDFKRKGQGVVHWVAAGIMCRVRYLQGDEMLRHAKLVGFSRS